MDDDSNKVGLVINGDNVTINNNGGICGGSNYIVRSNPIFNYYSSRSRPLPDTKSSASSTYHREVPSKKLKREDTKP